MNKYIETYNPQKMNKKRNTKSLQTNSTHKKMESIIKTKQKKKPKRK